MTQAKASPPPPRYSLMPPQECTDALAAEIMEAVNLAMLTHKISPGKALEVLTEAVDGNARLDNPILAALNAVCGKHEDCSIIFGEAIPKVMLQLLRKREAEESQGITASLKKQFAGLVEIVIPHSHHSHDRPQTPR